jgi:choline dehydrogenase-like flavoprotein
LAPIVVSNLMGLPSRLLLHRNLGQLKRGATTPSDFLETAEDAPRCGNLGHFTRHWRRHRRGCHSMRERSFSNAFISLCREVGNASSFRSLTKREAYPRSVGDVAFEEFVRNAAVPSWHYTCSAKMGRDDMSVVDGNLRVYGIDGLRISDGSIMPNVTTGNTMAPCVIIGERARLSG